MIRGTTPTITIKLRDIQANDIQSVFITFKQGDSVLITKTFDDGLEVDYDNNIIYVPLNQEDTLKFKNCPFQLQLRAVLNDLDGTVVASDVFISDSVGDILYEEVI